MEMFDLIEQVEDLLENGFTIPVIRKTLVDKQEIMELFEELRLNLPEELKQAKWVKEERQSFS